MREDRLLHFVIGFLVGLLLGAVTTAAAHLSQGYLNGWDVVRKDGGIICQDPYIYPNVREIECE